MIKTFIIISLFLSIKAISCEFPGYSQGIVSNININQKQYKSVLSIETLIKTPDFIIGEKDFPIPISEIIKVAFNAVNKLDKELKWDVESIGLHKYNYSNCVYWYYQVYFRSGNHYAYLNIGLNGESPDIYRIDEIKLN